VEVGDVDVPTVLEVLRKRGPHGVKDDPSTRGLDIFTFFEGRDLRRCDFTGIDHSLALSFADADLRHANLRGVQLHEADMRRADLRGADMTDARMSANFEGARVKGLLVDGSELVRCRFSPSAPDLARCASVHACDIVGTDLSYTRLLGRSFGGDLRDCDLTGIASDAIAVSGTWTRCRLTDALLDNAKAVGWVLVDCHAEGARLAGAALDSVELLDCRLPSLTADGADLSRSIIVGTDLSGASLAGASLAGADLERVSLVGADLRGADLTGASFDQVDTTDAHLDPGALSAVRSGGARRGR
jgi:uncharacterized protein YjbI with pentapeptide repeats